MRIKTINTGVLFSGVLTCLLLFTLSGQGAEIKNLRTGQQGNTAFATFDLQGKPGELEADVLVTIELHGEKYKADKLSLTGDFGKNVKTGLKRKIAWDLLKDMPAGYDGDLTWYVDAISSIVTNAKTGYTDPLTGMVFVSVPGGCFKMGDTTGEGDSDERPVHEVCLDNYYIGKYEVTQEQWQEIMGSNPSYFKHCGKNCPVEYISWNDSNSFIKKLNFKGNSQYRLPTESEWEYAANRGGEQNITKVSWNESNANGRTHPVGQKQANNLGIHDMNGNVAEWVLDIKEDYKAVSLINPQGAVLGINRIIKGGSWLSQARDVRPSSRSELTPSVKSNSVGFRLVASDIASN